MATIGDGSQRQWCVARRGSGSRQRWLLNGSTVVARWYSATTAARLWCLCSGDDCARLRWLSTEALDSSGSQRLRLSGGSGSWALIPLVCSQVVAFACGALHYGLSSSRISSSWDNQQNLRREDGGWWVLPAILAIIKTLQARLIDWHIANLEVPDPNLYSEDPTKFWES
ncbi:hypothetical protein QJS10_CPA10g01068 [Acorus calamus]|uniref:Uncharacterized protein n=1 Tax=Acorus calamus TaxID=4465 RepID=A0AAV9E0K3_ACOCL|nr:hypothetical protein QJS10_CPA10g01068 [Acorus calamus]